jgi:hypothetical protein
MEQAAVPFTPLWYGGVEKKPTEILVFRVQIGGQITNIDINVKHAGDVLVARRLHPLFQTQLV